MLFANYASPHRERLDQRARSPEWTPLTEEPGLLRSLANKCQRPGSAPSQMSGAAHHLIERNGPSVRRRIARGETDRTALLGALSRWETALADDEAFPIFFLGLVLTLGCSFEPRCLYCNQQPLPHRMTLEDWKALISEAATPIPPYLYLTGGEPLIMGEAIWGEQGIIAHAVGLGCAVNLNTNAALITPWVALQLVRSGLAKVHISLDSVDPDVQGELFGKADRVARVIAGIENLQVARELFGAGSPQIHINCVLTRKNLFQFPELLRYLLGIRPLPPSGPDGRRIPEGVLGDFAFHLIPVGGRDNEAIRPTAEEWKRFYTVTWDEAEGVWSDYAASLGLSEEERGTLAGHVPFASPFKRAEHRMSLDDYCRLAGEGVYWKGALMERCYLAPSQAYVLPDGSHRWCGAHAIGRSMALGSVKGSSLRANIRAGFGRLADLPSSACLGCAGATCVINHSIESSLKVRIDQWLAEPTDGAADEG